MKSLPTLAVVAAAVLLAIALPRACQRDTGPSRDSLALAAFADSLTVSRATAAAALQRADSLAGLADALTARIAARRALRPRVDTVVVAPADTAEALAFWHGRADTLAIQYGACEADADSLLLAGAAYRASHRECVQAAAILTEQVISAEGRLNVAASRIADLERRRDRPLGLGLGCGWGFRGPDCVVGLVYRVKLPFGL